MTHDYLQPLGDLVSAQTQIAVIMYDQLGVGRSTHLRNKESAFWTIDLFIDELINVLSHFGISDSFYLLSFATPFNTYLFQVRL